MVPVFWHSSLRVIPSPGMWTGVTNSPANNRILQKRWFVNSEIRFLKDCGIHDGYHFSFSLFSLCVGKSSYRVVNSHTERPTW